MILPGIDGVDHINIYSNGKTELGRALSNFSDDGFELYIGWIPYNFASAEALWYYLLIDKDKAKEEEICQLVNLSGHTAKKYGKLLLERHGIFNPTKDFEIKFKFGLMAKLDQHQRIQKLLTQSELPLCHYYNYKGKLVDAGFDWMVEFWEMARKLYKLLNRKEY